MLCVFLFSSNYLWKSLDMQHSMIIYLIQASNLDILKKTQEKNSITQVKKLNVLANFEDRLTKNI